MSTLRRFKCLHVMLILTMSMLLLLDAEAEVERAPGAPLDVRCLDANKDYIIVSWKQPAVDGGDSISGYFVDRSVDTRQGSVEEELRAEGLIAVVWDILLYVVGNYMVSFKKYKINWMD